MKRKNIFALNSILKNNYLSPNQAKKYDIKIAMDGVKRSCLEIMGQRKVNMAKIRQVFTHIPIFPRLYRKSSCNRCSLHGLPGKTRKRYRVF